MKYRKLGASDLEVSEISLGSWLTYGVGVARDSAAACVDRAFDLGINFIDTANVYGRGAAETFLGEVLARRPRNSYVLATKVYFPMGATDQGLSRAQIAKQIDASLKRLRVDHVDLYQCHRYDASTPLEETMQALTDVVRHGKARYHRLQRMVAGADRAGVRDRRHGALRVEPAAILHALARPRTGSHPALRRERHLADRLVAARTGRAVGQVRAGRRSGRPIRGPAATTMGHSMQSWLAPAILEAVQKLPAARPGSRLHPGAVRAGLGAA